MCCGLIDERNRPQRDAFQCVGCGFTEHADVVGAINVLRLGYSRIACEVSGAVRPPAAGTHRSDLKQLHVAMNAAGIPLL